jgi:hypothetical protein
MRLAVASMVAIMLLVLLFPGIGAMATENTRISPMLQKPGIIRPTIYFSIPFYFDRRSFLLGMIF